MSAIRLQDESGRWTRASELRADRADDGKPTLSLADLAARGVTAIRFSDAPITRSRRGAGQQEQHIMVRKLIRAIGESDANYRFRLKHMATALRESKQAPGAAPPSFDAELGGVHVPPSAACADCGAPVEADEDGQSVFSGDATGARLTCPTCGAPLRHVADEPDADDVEADEAIGDADALEELGDELTADELAAYSERFPQVICGGCGDTYQLREAGLPLRCPNPRCGASWSTRDVRWSDRTRAALAARERQLRRRDGEPVL